MVFGIVHDRKDTSLAVVWHTRCCKVHHIIHTSTKLVGRTKYQYTSKIPRVSNGSTEFPNLAAS